MQPLRGLLVHLFVIKVDYIDFILNFKSRVHADHLPVELNSLHNYFSHNLLDFNPFIILIHSDSKVIASAKTLPFL